MSLSQKRIAVIIAAIALVGIVVVIAHTLMQTKRDGITEYKNRAFSFSFPAKYDINEYQSDFVAIGTKDAKDTTGKNFDTDVLVSVVKSNPALPPASEEAFFTAQAKLTCAADLPGQILSCDNVKVQPSFFSASGDKAYEYRMTLTKRTAGSDSTLTSDVSVYVFPTGTKGASKFSGVLVYAPPTNTADELKDVNELLRSVALSLKLPDALPATP
ncbi:MAG: hypothetical protein JWN64_405 [Parcubacteria group bacterium]|nr:hypothetical protein [Parcubacteria group bacterium]